MNNNIKSSNVLGDLPEIPSNFHVYEKQTEMEQREGALKLDRDRMLTRSTLVLLRWYLQLFVSVFLSVCLQLAANKVLKLIPRSRCCFPPI